MNPNPYNRPKDLQRGPIREVALLSREVAAEGIVLLKNDNHTLPFSGGERISIFGRTQIDYIKSGSGSGGLVHTEYVVSILDAFKQQKKVHINEELAAVYEKWVAENPIVTNELWIKPYYQPEMPISPEMIEKASKSSNAALFVIGRLSGEENDNVNEKGSYRLSDEEEELLTHLCSHFKKVCVILNTGNIIDMSFMDKYPISAVLYVWQGGQEGGNGIVDVLCGEVSPSGKLTDTIPYHIEDYPSYHNFGSKEENIYQEDIYVGYRYFETFKREKIRYPFGFGLSYTRFDIEVTSSYVTDRYITLEVKVRNNGGFPGKEVVQIYVEPPQGVLGKPVRNLVAFEKTNTLLPGSEALLQFRITVDDFKSFDDSGLTGYKNCYVLEAGAYHLYAGSDVRSAVKVFTYDQGNLKIVESLSEVLAPPKEFHVMCPVEDQSGHLEISYRPVATRTIDVNKRMMDHLPEDLGCTGNKGYKLADVYHQSITMEDFIRQLRNEELACLSRGEGMNSPKVTAGTTSAFGGVTDELLAYGIPICCTTDGPSGLRMDDGSKASCLPSGTMLASTWNKELVKLLFSFEGLELYVNQIDILLGPGTNIHRHPLTGRNFEYFSEDPYLSGQMAASVSSGLNQFGACATIKHFAANHQELARDHADSVVSQRALREIYLKPFEIAVKVGHTKAIMTSYNPINGIWNAGNYDLNTTVLRNEWGYTGFVMTDWWAMMNDVHGDASKYNLKAMVRAQNDVYMVVPDTKKYQDNILESLEKGTLTRGELQRNAINLCNYIMSSFAFERILQDGGNKQTNNCTAACFVQKLSYIQPLQRYSMDIAKAGLYEVKITLSSDTPSLAQSIVRMDIDDTTALSLTVNGTDDQFVELSRQIEITGNSLNVIFYFSSEVITIKEVSVFAIS
jgi:beta-glucosidase